jgi:hypothetical protein
MLVKKNLPSRVRRRVWFPGCDQYVVWQITLIFWMNLLLHLQDRQKVSSNNGTPYQTTQRHNTKEHNLNLYHHKNH